MDIIGNPDQRKFNLNKVLYMFIVRSHSIFPLNSMQHGHAGQGLCDGVTSE